MSTDQLKPITPEEAKSLLEANPKAQRCVKNIRGTLINLQKAEEEVRKAHESPVIVPGVEQKLEKAQLQVARALDEISALFNELHTNGEHRLLQVCIASQQEAVQIFMAILYSLHATRTVRTSGGTDAHQRMLREAYALLARLPA